jgi:hypothetical protein
MRHFLSGYYKSLQGRSAEEIMKAIDPFFQLEDVMKQQIRAEYGEDDGWANL